MSDDTDIRMLQARVSELEVRLDDRDIGDPFRGEDCPMPDAVDVPHTRPIIAFIVSFKTPLTATIIPGEVELGPATVLQWDGKRMVNGTEAATGQFTNNLTDETTITVPTGNATWHVWANIDIREDAEKWTLNQGATITPLTDSQEQGDDVLRNTRQKKIATLHLTKNVITSIDQWQSGNIDIPRL